MQQPTFKEKFQYWFDNQMSKGSVSLIKLLTISTIAVILIVTLLNVIISGGDSEGFAPVLWDSFSTVINAWMPAFEDGEGSIAYLILMSCAAICGLLVTSVLIGIVSSGIEEKITSLRQGNSRVLEQGHTVVIGFTPGEFTLLRQLILAAADDKKCIVIAAEQDREELEEAVKDNLEVPDNVRIICRSIDIFDPVSLEKCSLSQADNIIISPTDDKTTAKALLAASLVINKSNNPNVHIGAIMQKERYRFPESVAKKHHVTTLQTSDVIAKIIAHSCTQPGLSKTFIELFNFEGSELYSVSIPEAVGRTFAQLMEQMDLAVPVGIYRNGEVVLNPDPNEMIAEGDNLIIFAEEKDSYKILPAAESLEEFPDIFTKKETEDSGEVIVIGYNKSFVTVLKELPDNVGHVLAESKKKYHDTIRAIDDVRDTMEIDIIDKDIDKIENLEKIVKNAKHIVLLSDRDMDEEDADMQIIFRIMNLRDIRERLGLDFNITAEMRRENNQVLIRGEDNIDFVVASNLSSLFLAQLSESPELSQAFSELLSNEGNELYLKRADNLHCEGTYTVREIRRIAFKQGYIVLGFMENDNYQSVFNSPLDEKYELDPEDRLIVMGIE